MKSYFTLNIHPALIEAAKIDGASEFYIYRNRHAAFAAHLGDDRPDGRYQLLE